MDAIQTYRTSVMERSKPYLDAITAIRRPDDFMGPLSEFVKHYVAQYAGIFADGFDAIWDWHKHPERQDDGTVMLFGDADSAWKQMHDETVGGRRRRVLHLEDRSTTSDVNQFILIREQYVNDRPEEAGASHGILHVRAIYKNGDYHRGNTLVERPSLRWFKDRKWNLDYQEKLKNTALGFCFGDGRDPGYVVTFKYESLLQAWEVEYGIMKNIMLANLVLGNIQNAVYEINELKEVEA